MIRGFGCPAVGQLDFLNSANAASRGYFILPQDEAFIFCALSIPRCRPR